jgi:hypothetical protein
MGLPNIEINFKQTAASAIKRGSRGIVAVILKDAVPVTNPVVMDSVADIPTTLTATNQLQLTNAWIGYINPPKQVIAYVLAADAVDYTAAETYLETIRFDYIAVPDIQTAEITAFMAWVKTCRDNKDLKFVAVLPNAASDYEGIVNFNTDGIIVGAITYTAAGYCSRIAGILAGTPLYMSATFAPLLEVSDCPHHTKAELDALINAGDLVLFNDGEKVKIARAVNSLITITADKGNDFKKIKIVDIMDMIHDDIKTTADDNYIGKFSNSYNNKCILLTAIKAYLQTLEGQTLLEIGQSLVSIDVAANKTFLESQGTDTTKMTDQQIKEAVTESSVFLTGTIKPQDAMEDLTLNLYM